MNERPALELGFGGWVGVAGARGAARALGTALGVVAVVFRGALLLGTFFLPAKIGEARGRLETSLGKYTLSYRRLVALARYDGPTSVNTRRFSVL